MTVKTQTGTWVVTTEKRKRLQGSGIVEVNVAVAYNEANGYVKEFYGTCNELPVIDLT